MPLLRPIQWSRLGSYATTVLSAVARNQRCGSVLSVIPSCSYANDWTSQRHVFHVPHIRFHRFSTSGTKYGSNFANRVAQLNLDQFQTFVSNFAQSSVRNEMIIVKSTQPEVCEAFQRRFDHWCQQVDINSVDQDTFLAALELVDLWKLVPEKSSVDVITSWLINHLDQLTGMQLNRCLYSIRTYGSVKNNECLNANLPNRIVQKSFELLESASPSELSRFTSACVSLNLEKECRSYDQKYYKISESRLQAMTSQELIEFLTSGQHLLPYEAPPSTWANALEMTVLTRLRTETVDNVCRILQASDVFGDSFS